MSHSHAAIGFAASSRRGKKKSKGFTPTEKQISTARHRMICTLNKHDGATPVRSFNDAVDFFCKEVYNRGQELGTYAGKQFKKTIRTAFHQLLESGEMIVDLEEGMVMLTDKAEIKSKRRTHNQKYPVSRRALAVA